MRKGPLEVHLGEENCAGADAVVFQHNRTPSALKESMPSMDRFSTSGVRGLENECPVYVPRAYNDTGGTIDPPGGDRRWDGTTTFFADAAISSWFREQFPQVSLNRIQLKYAS